MAHHVTFDGIRGGPDPLSEQPPDGAQEIFLDFRGDSAPADWNQILTATDPNTIITYRNDGVIPEFHPSQYAWIGTVANRDAIITDVWKMVADRYSMFNVNVTTIPPTAQDEAADNFITVLFDDLAAGWYQVNNPSVKLDTGYLNMEGFGSRGGGSPTPGNYFTDNPQASRSCLEFVSTVIGQNSTSNARRALAFAATHEAGHMLGSAHDATITIPVASLMHFGTGNGGGGVNGRLRFGWSGIYWGTENRTLYKFNKIRDALGYRPGEESDTQASAIPLGLGPWTYFSHEGIIHRHDDVDYFTFTTNTPGAVTIRVSPKLTGMENGRYYHSVDTRISLLDPFGAPFYTSDPSQNEPLSNSTDPTGANWPGYKPEIQVPMLGAGQYWIKVEPSAAMGADTHGDLGQYVLEVWR